MAQIVPGILTDSEDVYFKRLRMAEHVSDLIQIDVVDGQFAKSTTVGVDIIKKYPTSSNLEIQLMVNYPLNYIDELVRLEYVGKIIFPFEINGDVAETIYSIKKFEKQVGISLNPETTVEAALHFFDDIQLLLLMTGRPGFSGQKLGETTYDRIRKAKKLNPQLPVEVDIGVSETNANQLAKSGADFLVSSSALYDAVDFSLAYEKLASLANVAP